MSSSKMECEVITNQPSARSSSIPSDGTHPPDLTPDTQKAFTVPQNEEISSQTPLIVPTEDHHPTGLDKHTTSPNGASDAQHGATKQLKEASETPKQDTNLPNEETDVQNTVTNSQNEIASINEKSLQPESNKDSRNYSVNGPNIDPGAANLGLSLCLTQCCNICAACCVDSCTEYYNWCCCCFTDSEICVTCCSGCMDCCAGCDCATCCN